MGGLTLEERLGHGAHGEVWKGRSSSGSLIAIKLAKGETGRTSLVAEEEAYKKLGAHPCVVRLLSSNLAGDKPYLVFEFHPGGTIRDLINRAAEEATSLNRTWGITAKRAFSLIGGLMEGLMHAHSRGVVHGDVKPENVLLDASGQPKLIDFGLSRKTTPSLSLSGVFKSTAGPAGTVAYMSPEQAQGNSARPEDDAYSLGVMFFELVTGDLPRGPVMPTAKIQRLPPEVDSAYVALTSSDPLVEVWSQVQGIVSEVGGDPHTRSSGSEVSGQGDRQLETVSGRLKMLVGLLAALCVSPLAALGARAIKQEVARRARLERIQREQQRIEREHEESMQRYERERDQRLLQLERKAMEKKRQVKSAQIKRDKQRQQREELAADNRRRRAKDFFKLAVDFDSQSKAKEACSHYQSAADLGHVEAMTRLGLHFSRGQGVKKDLKRAHTLFSTAATQGSLDAEFYLARSYIEQENFPAARSCLKKAALGGHLAAKVELGCLYQEGRGGARDEQEAGKWFLEAAEGGSTDGMYYLASLYLRGTEGFKQSYKKAAHWYLEGAKKNHLASIAAYVDLLQKGHGVKRDEAQAEAWLSTLRDLQKKGGQH